MNRTITYYDPAQPSAPSAYDQNAQVQPLQPQILEQQYVPLHLVSPGQYLPHQQIGNFRYGMHALNQPMQQPHSSMLTPQLPTNSNTNTNWKQVQHKKRPRNQDSPENKERSTKQTTLSDYWLSKPIATSNSYSPLTEENEQTQDQTDDKMKTDPISKNDGKSTNATLKNTKPPPIFIEGVEYVQPLTKALDACAAGNYTLKSLNNQQVKVQPNNPESYAAIIKALEEKSTKFHTYQLKQNRTFRVVIRNIHPTTDQNELKGRT